MKFLVHANVLSEPTKQSPIDSVTRWLLENEKFLVVNPIVLGELEFGILRLPVGRKQTQLREWFAEAPQRVRVVDIDINTAQVWANLIASLRRQGRAMPVSDSLIAASALQHHLIVATRNTEHYRYTGVELINPFEL